MFRPNVLSGASVYHSRAGDSMEFYTKGVNKCIETRVVEEPQKTSSFMLRNKAICRNITFVTVRKGRALWKDE